MEFLIGAGLALGVGLFATAVGLDRERGFYPVVLIVVAGYYVLFATMGGAPDAIVVETLIACGFIAVAALGFKRSLWLVVAALAGHGILDMVHPHLATNPGAPRWWPMFCLAFDLTAASYLAVHLVLTPGSLRFSLHRRQECPLLAEDEPPPLR